MSNQDKTLVVGGTGRTGRRVVDRLQQRRASYRAVSRSTQPAFDWHDRRTWQPALNGCPQAYVTYSPDLCVPGAVEEVQNFFTEAVEAGVRRLVLLTGRGEPKCEQAENALKASGANWTILRCSFFAQNFSENFFLDSILAGAVALPIGPVGEPFVDADDIADVAVAALMGEGHSGQLYELTGPRALTFADAIGEIARTSGRDIRYLTVTQEQYRAGLVEAHVPDEIIELIIYLFSTVLDGRNTPVADGIMRALGRPARDFSEYVRETAATGVWGS